MYRLFVALALPSHLRRQLRSVMHGVTGARWQRDDQLHLTLHFVGEVDGGRAEDIADLLATIGGPRPRVAIRGTGVFVRRNVVHTLWAGIAADDGLALLQRGIERALRGNNGIAPRKFHPHVTLARLNRSTGPVEPFLRATSGLRGESERLDAFGLYESTLSPDGSHYDLVARYPLSDHA